MKAIWIGLIGVFVLAKVYSNYQSYHDIAVSENGIQFFEGTWEEALQKADAENKPIFLDIYASWCGPCKLLKKTTFSDEKVGSYFNEKFINVAYDGEMGDGLTLARKYEIKGYPSLLFVDKDEKVITQTAGYYQATELLRLGKKASRKSK